MDKYIGKRLDGRYEIKEIIGVGGMAMVYKAYDTIDDRIVAVKILREEFLANEEFRRRFKNESKAIAVLSHPNIVKVYDVSFGDEIQYIVMEYIDGITLKQYIERKQRLDEREAVYFTIQILRALQHAHSKGIVHRDIKPQNIMLLKDGTIKVTDFGIARFSRSEQRTMTDKAIGSVHYISPEQAKGEFTDEKSDIYSVGVMLYEMLTGQLPFEADSAVSVAIMQLQREPVWPRQINENIPLGLEQIVMHAMEKDPEKRYQSATEMLTDLEAFRKKPQITFSYIHDVDESPTKYIGEIGENDTTAAEEGEETVKKPPMVAIMAGIAAAFIVVIVVAVIIFYNVFMKDGPSDEMPCPNFVGLLYTEVMADPAYSGYNIELREYENSDQPYDTIIRQSPTKDTPIKSGSTIQLVVSSGPKTLELPSDLVGLRLNDVTTRLDDLGIAYTVEERYSNVVNGEAEYAADIVMQTNPEPGSLIATGQTVTIYVSLGKAPNLVTVPDLKNYTKDTAEQLLLNYGLKLGNITYEDSADVAANCIIRQTPEQGSQVEAYSAVDVVVSTGISPEPTVYSGTIRLDFSQEMNIRVNSIVLYLNNNVIGNSTETINLATTKSAEIPYETTEQQGVVLIRINGYNYQELSYDFVNNKLNYVNRVYDDSPFINNVTSSSTPSSSSSPSSSSTPSSSSSGDDDDDNTSSRPSTSSRSSSR